MPLLTTGIGGYQIISGGGGGATFFGGSALARMNAFGAYPGFTANGGSSLPTCLFLLGIYNSDIANPAITIGGTSLGSPLVANSTNANLIMYAVNLTAGNGDTVAISNGTSMDRIFIATCWVTGMTTANIGATTSEAPWATQSDPQHSTTSLTVPASGFGIGLLGAHQSVGATVPTPGLTWATSTSIVNNAGDSTSINAVNGGTASFAHTATAGAGWTPSVACTGGSSSYNFSAGILAITVG